MKQQQIAYCIHDIANLDESGNLIDVYGEYWFSRLIYAQGSFTMSNIKRQDLTITFDEVNPGAWNVYAAFTGEEKQHLIGRITEFRFPNAEDILHAAEHL